MTHGLSPGECRRRGLTARTSHMRARRTRAQKANRRSCSAVEVPVADLVPVEERGLALLHIEVLGVGLARDVKGQEAGGLDAGEDELVLLPHVVVGEVEVEGELPHLLDDAGVDEVLEALPLLVRAHLEPQHVDLVVLVAVHDRLHRQHGNRHVGLGEVV
eukprot:scaffold58590_cov71-Phaeocystis_antarctica.AAC.1